MNVAFGKAKQYFQFGSQDTEFSLGKALWKKRWKSVVVRETPFYSEKKTLQKFFLHTEKI